LKPPMVAIQWSGSSWLPALKEIGISQDSLDTIVIQWFIGIYNNHYKDPYCGWDDHQPYSEYWPWLICPYVPPHFWMNLIMTSHRDVTGMMLSFHDHPKWPSYISERRRKGGWWTILTRPKRKNMIHHVPLKPMKSLLLVDKPAKETPLNPIKSHSPWNHIRSHETFHEIPLKK
jgi:hypothetical protein